MPLTGLKLFRAVCDTPLIHLPKFNFIIYFPVFLYNCFLNQQYRFKKNKNILQTLQTAIHFNSIYATKKYSSGCFLWTLFLVFICLFGHCSINLLEVFIKLQEMLCVNLQPFLPEIFTALHNQYSIKIRGWLIYVLIVDTPLEVINHPMTY